MIVAELFISGACCINYPNGEGGRGAEEEEEGVVINNPRNLIALIKKLARM